MNIEKEEENLSLQIEKELKDILCIIQKNHIQRNLKNYFVIYSIKKKF